MGFEVFDYECQGQISIFDLLNAEAQEMRIDKPIRLIELFGGIGSQAMALRDIGAVFEHYRLIEYDKYPVASYNAIHGTDFKPMDITKIHGHDLGIVEKEKYCYIMTYSFPCQDLSLAGRQAGMAKGSGTRSGLLWEVERLLNEVDSLPQVLLMENVPQVHSKANMDDFTQWLSFLESKGYKNYWQDLNARDYGVAQNRKRCFCVSVLGNYTYTFPAPVELKKTMKDYLESDVDRKYYITSEKAKKLCDELLLSGKILDGHEVICLTKEDVDRMIAEGKILQTDRQTDRQTDSALICQQTGQEQSPAQTVSKQDMTVESAGLQQTEQECVNIPAYLNYNRIDAVGVEVGRTLDTRCCTLGTSVQTQNGVIVCRKLSE